MQAKWDRKTLDFTCVLTENHHKVNLAVLHDLSRNSYIELRGGESICIWQFQASSCRTDLDCRLLFIIAAQMAGCLHCSPRQASTCMHMRASVFLSSSTLASTSLSSESQATYLVWPVCTMRIACALHHILPLSTKQVQAAQPLKREGGLGKFKKGHCAGCLDTPIECCREEAEEGQSKAKALRCGRGEGGANRGDPRQPDSAHPPAGRGDPRGGREDARRKPRHAAKRAPCSPS